MTIAQGTVTTIQKYRPDRARFLIPLTAVYPNICALFDRLDKYYRDIYWGMHKSLHDQSRICVVTTTHICVCVFVDTCREINTPKQPYRICAWSLPVCIRISTKTLDVVIFPIFSNVKTIIRQADFHVYPRFCNNTTGFYRPSTLHSAS